MFHSIKNHFHSQDFQRWIHTVATAHPYLFLVGATIAVPSTIVVCVTVCTSVLILPLAWLGGWI